MATVEVLLFVLFSQAFVSRRQEERHRRDFLNSTEFPAELIDPAAIDLTPLVNTLINSSQSGSRQLFSLLSVTSYSSLALHKLTLLVYNISSIRGLESNMLRRRFCYCVTNDTNDLTDFTAILLDVMGNSTSYLHELFKSSSILSVSQKNNSACIYICVMAGKMGRELPELWEVGSVTPLFNQTIVEGPHTANVSSIRLPLEWHQLPTNLSHISPSGMSSMLTSRVHSTAHDNSSSNYYDRCKKLHESNYSRETADDAESDDAKRRDDTTNNDTKRDDTTHDDTKRDDTTHDNPRSKNPNDTKSDNPTNDDAKSNNPKRNHTSDVTKIDDTTYDDAKSNNPRSNYANDAKIVNATNDDTKSNDPKRNHTSDVTIYRKTNNSSHDINATNHNPASHHCVGSRYRSPVGTTVAERVTRRPTTPSKSVEAEKAGCPWRRQELTYDDVSGSTTTVGAHKLQPCVLELCKFFSQCLCRPFSYKTRMKRYCDDSHLWYEKHTFEVCRRVRRISFSRNLKQRCLTRMCNKL
ncbi:uncharacterized protein LOC128369783 [Scomber japonicus]|uniref:uncharacterized protein LOC128369783 n=1 Tax=Scomber japonicus TaxID=13676 RepID=UPI0023051678|nr:uncharacterized protein LOC128369783 [Scomber japonicus]